MKKALVVGATGNMGFAIVKELVSRGISVTAFARGREKLMHLFGGMEKVNIFVGNVFLMETLMEAAKDVDVIFHAMNVPYPEWEKKQPLLINNILKTTEQTGAKLVVVDNIYAYGQSDGKKVTESSPKMPNTKKGNIRLRLETKIKQSGVQAIIAHFPDFYGPNGENTLLHHTFQAVLANKRAMFIGNQRIKREYIYTPDGAKALVELSLRDSAYGQNWNIPGSGVISGEEIMQLLRDVTGYQKRVVTVTKPMVWLLGLFNNMMREYHEMMYLTEEPVVLNGEKLEKEIGEIPMTPYKNGIMQTLKYMKRN